VSERKTAPAVCRVEAWAEGGPVVAAVGGPAVEEGPVAATVERLRGEDLHRGFLTTKDTKGTKNVVGVILCRSGLAREQT
jgi:hypothetical protein